MTVERTKDPVREAYRRIAGILETLQPLERSRVMDAVATLFDMTKPKES